MVRLSLHSAEHLFSMTVKPALLVPVTEQSACKDICVASVQWYVNVLLMAGDFYGGWITSKLVGPFKGSPGTLGWWHNTWQHQQPSQMRKQPSGQFPTAGEAEMTCSTTLNMQASWGWHST